MYCCRSQSSGRDCVTLGAALSDIRSHENGHLLHCNSCVHIAPLIHPSSRLPVIYVYTTKRVKSILMTKRIRATVQAGLNFMYSGKLLHGAFSFRRKWHTAHSCSRVIKTWNWYVCGLSLLRSSDRPFRLQLQTLIDSFFLLLFAKQRTTCGQQMAFVYFVPRTMTMRLEWKHDNCYESLKKKP